MSAEVLPLSGWIGRSETASDLATEFPCAALAATLECEAPAPRAGEELPPLWHWLYFLPVHRMSELAPDGHAHRGGFLPPVARPRRMWAGSQLEFHAPLRVGDRLRRVSTIVDIQDKQGRTGAMTFVKVRHELHAGDAAAPALTELHDIVYRDLPGPDAPAAEPRAAAQHSAWQRRIVPDDVLLFRYSALTFNGHRIHYDRRYVTEVEGYPGLIVHGPLLATLLLDLLRRHAPQAAVAAFRFRAVRPVFDLHPFTVHGEPGADGREVRLWVADHEGWLAMEATAIVR